MIGRLVAVAVKELLQLKRDWRSAAALFGMPVILLLLYGYALSFDVEDVRLAVVDLDRTVASRQLRTSFTASRYFRLVHHGGDERVLDGLLDRGTAQAGLVIPDGYGGRLAAGERAAVQFVLDGSDANTANTVLGYARQVVAEVSPLLDAETRSGPVRAAATVWYNPALRSSYFLIPGLVAFILMITGVIATSLAVVREKERGTMESLRATPLTALELLLGKTFPYLVLSSASAGGSLLLAWLLFDVPVRGSLLWLSLMTVLFLLGALGWGVLISTISDTQQVAFQMGLLTSMLPTLVLSGFVFPISSMPPGVQAVTLIIPARYYVAALREIMLKTAGPEVWWQDAAALAVFAVVVVGVATLRTVRSL